jgi:hypothetical protein
MSSTEPSESTGEAPVPLIEQLAVTFFETPCLAVRSGDGTIYMAIRDVCDAIGLRLSGQLRRLRAHPDLKTGLARFRVATAGGLQLVDCLILEFVPAWIATVSRANATPIVQERLRYFTLFSIREVYAAVHAKPACPLGLAARSRIWATSRPSIIASSASRSASRRLRTARTRRGRHGAISTHAWTSRGSCGRGQAVGASARHGLPPGASLGQERATRERVSIGVALRACWSTLRTRYKVSRYEDIESGYFDDCVAYIQRQYQKLTGTELKLPEQGELDL